MHFLKELYNLMESLDFMYMGGPEADDSDDEYGTKKGHNKRFAIVCFTLLFGILRYLIIFICKDVK